MEESALFTVESAEGRNFREFADLQIFAKVYTCENVLFGSLCKILTITWKIGPKTHENEFIYLFNSESLYPQFFLSKVTSSRF